MPWKVEKRGNLYYVIKETTGKSISKGVSSKSQAERHVRALYANVHEGAQKVMSHVKGK